MNSEIFFYLGLSAMLIHEMDAVRCKEWRIFPGLSLLNDNWGFRLFMIAHVPLFCLLFWGLMAEGNPAQLKFGLDIFFIVHVGLHVLFLKHKKNEFKDLASWTIILSAGLFGLLDILI
ncbi:MAG: DUF6713 family protein [Cyclobacteriaceae bacterium]